MKKFFLLLSLLVFFAAPASILFAGSARAEDIASLQARADKGDDVAQFNLGSRYFNGTGIAKSDLDAANWWRRAAKQGNHGAQLQLARLYDQGRGLEQDDRKAYFWYSIAAGDSSWNLAYQASAGRDKVAKNLSPAALADADKAVAAWSPVAEQAPAGTGSAFIQTR